MYEREGEWFLFDIFFVLLRWEFYFDWLVGWLVVGLLTVFGFCVFPQLIGPCMIWQRSLLGCCGGILKFLSIFAVEFG